MRTRIARFTTRLQGEGDGLIIGAVLKTGEHFFKPSSVYELVYNQFSESIELVYVGEATPAKEGETYKDSPIGQHWAFNIADILAEAGKELFISREELRIHNATLNTTDY